VTDRAGEPSEGFWSDVGWRFSWHIAQVSDPGSAKSLPHAWQWPISSLWIRFTDGGSSSVLLRVRREYEFLISRIKYNN